jgi:hypothetical protein
MGEIPTVQDGSQQTSLRYKNADRRFYLTIPLYLAVPVAYWLAFAYAGTPMQWAAFGLGAAGWIIALMLRGPVAALVRKLPKERAATLVGAASGPLEEGVRCLVLVATGTAYPWAVSLGQGWAAIEVLFTVVNGIVLVTMLQRTDEKAMQVRAALEAQGHRDQNPLMGVVERIFASAFHIGSTLLIAKYLWLVIVMMPVHTALNLIAVRLARKSAILAETFVAFAGLVVFLTGLHVQ